MSNKLLPRNAAFDGKYNPMNSYREGQLPAIISCWGAIHNGYKVIALDAGTGSGKSILGAALGNLSQSSYICTTQKNLQDQYLSLGTKFKKTIGRSNFVCIASGKKKTCNQGDCITKDNFKCRFKPSTSGKYHAYNNMYWHYEDESKRCKYWRNVESGVNAPQTIFNYAYYILKMNSPYNDFSKRGIQILDEGHNLEEHIRNVSTFEIHDRGLYPVCFNKNIDYTPYDEFENIPQEIQTKTSAIEWLERLREVVEIRQNETRISKETGNDEAVRRLNDLHSLADRIKNLLLSYSDNADNWVFLKEITGFKLVPLYIGDFFRDTVLPHADVTLIMSATLPSKKVLCKRLGLNEDEIFYYTMDSTFPPENSTIFSYAQPTMNYVEGGMDAKRNRMGKKIIDVLKKHPNKRGLILCNSFKEVEHYERQMRDTSREEYMRLVVHQRGDKIEYLLDEHRDSTNRVILSPSAWEGLDLLGTLGEFLIISKVPFGDMSSPVIQGLKELDVKRYFEDTCMKIRQGTGRIIRSPDDKGDIYLLDGSFRRLYRFNKSEFPLSFQERVVIV